MRKSLIVMTLLILLLSACLPGQTPEEAQNQINTAVAVAIATQQAAIDQAVAMTLTSVAQNASPTPVAPPDTPTLVSFPSTLTPVIPTITPINTPSSGGGGGGGGGNTSSAYSCAIIAQKPNDGTHFKPGDSFDTSWTIKNTGTVTWEANWDFEYRGGTDMSPTAPGFKIGQEVKPGGTITLVIEVEAPDVAAKDAGKIFTMTWSINKGSHFCTPYIAIKVFPPGTE